MGSGRHHARSVVKTGEGPVPDRRGSESREQRHGHFLSRFKHIFVPAHRCRFFSFFFPEIMLYSARPVSHEGRFAVVTNVEAGCGGRVAVAAWLNPRRRTMAMRTVKSRGPDTPMLVSRLRRRSRAARATVAKKPGAPGRSRSSRQNHRAGNAGWSRLNLW
jgi:hypothetical protein